MYRLHFASALLLGDGWLLGAAPPPSAQKPKIKVMCLVSGVCPRREASEGWSAMMVVVVGGGGGGGGCFIYRYSYSMQP